MMNFLRIAFALFALGGNASAQVMQLAAGQIIGNTTTARAPGQASNLSSIIDRAMGAARGSVLVRQSTAWVPLAPGTTGLPLLSAGVGADLAYGILGLAAGGCNAALTASAGGILWTDSTKCNVLAGTATARQMLQSGASLTPAWSTSTWPATTTINQILYSSAANVVSGLATANGGILNAGATGVPSVTITPTLGVVSTSTGQINLANSGSAFLTTIQAGAAAAARTWTWPTNFGAAGCVMSDAAGNGVLSCASLAGTGTVTSVSWTGGIVSIATATSTPAFTVAGTSGGVVCFTSTSTWASSTLLAAGGILTGGGAGVCPGSNATGTGVVTALGVNVGSAGAFVTFGGALGTPSSGNGSNLSGIVTSIAGNNGAFTLGAGLTNSTNSILIDAASNANYLAGTANKVVAAGVIYQAEVTVTFGATTTFDFSTFNNAVVTLTGNITTQTLSNVTAGKSGSIRFIQDGTGSRTSVFSTTFKFAGGTIPTLTTTASAVDILNYHCTSSTFCEASLAKDVRNP